MFKVFLITLIFASQALAFSLFDNNMDKKHLNVIHAIKDVVISTQKTRGLTNNYMNGNVVAQLLVYGQRKQMLKNFNKVELSFKELELSAQYYSDATALMLRSKRLNKVAFKENASEVFAVYSVIIQRWMDLNAEIIRVGFYNSNKKIYTDVNFLNQVLLPLTENIGKMRGLGSGIVAKGYCTNKEAGIMNRFVDEIQRYELLLTYHMSKTEYITLEKIEVESIRKDIKNYVEMTKDNVIYQDEIRLVTNEYFNQGTENISNVLNIYNAISSSLE